MAMLKKKIYNTLNILFNNSTFNKYKSIRLSFQPFYALHLQKGKERGRDWETPENIRETRT